MKRTILIATLLILLFSRWTPLAKAFEWKGATVYFLITDRFCNGDKTNDVNYGRIVDYGAEKMNAATFHGGDIAGILEKAREGYFTSMGIDVVWITDVYEQIHGWMTGSGSVNDFPHYGYHGYYPLDYTQMDKNFGTIAEFRELVNLLHSQGIRVMCGANINDPGYPTLLDAVQYGFADVGMSANEAAKHHSSWSYNQFFKECGTWNGWYDSEWIRMPGENWDQTNPLETTLYGMPDFKDENENIVKIPDFLKRKWTYEGTKNDPWVNPSAKKWRTNRNANPLQYVIGWITSWVEEFGIDGFRCDIVENVRLNRWKELNDSCQTALRRWREKHKEDVASGWTDDFYLTGDFEDADIDYKADYARAGFSSIVNCNFPKHGDLNGIVYVWQAYADSMARYDNWHPFNYLNNSYHRDAEDANMIDCATTLLLAPGIAQIFYGDETGRTLNEARYNVDSAQAFRSNMNWETIDSIRLHHFRRLGKIRKDNPVIATGKQITLDVYTCIRMNDKDTVIIALNPKQDRDIKVGNLYEDGTVLIELYTGQEATVSTRKVRFPAYDNRVAVLKRKRKE